MRVRSRSARLIGAAILLLVGVLYLYGLWQHPVIIGALTITCTVVFICNKRRWQRNLAALAQERHGESICEFARAFDTRTTDTWVIRAVYEQLQHQLRWVYPEFPVHPTDRLIEDLGLDPDDIDMDLAADVTERTGRSWRNAKSNPFYGRVKTVADLVHFYCAQQKTT